MGPRIPVPKTERVDSKRFLCGRRSLRLSWRFRLTIAAVSVVSYRPGLPGVFAAFDASLVRSPPSYACATGAPAPAYSVGFTLFRLDRLLEELHVNTGFRGYLATTGLAPPSLRGLDYGDQRTPPVGALPPGSRCFGVIAVGAAPDWAPDTSPASAVALSGRAALPPGC